MPEPIQLRSQRLPERLVVVRLGAVTLDDRRLGDACARTHDRWGLWGFSVLEVPGGDDYGLLVRLRPEVGLRRQILVADGRQLTAAGFPLLPTLDFPHWTVVLAEASAPTFERIREYFRGPVQNPGWDGRP